MYRGRDYEETTADIGVHSHDNVSPQEYFRLRSRAIAQLKEHKDPKEQPYPHKYHVEISLTEFIARYNGVADGEILDDVVSVAGKMVVC